MRWVDVPYEVGENKLMIQKVEWPGRCACCGQDHRNETYLFGTKIGISSTYVYGRQSSETFFPVSFSAPYCASCKQHAAPAINVYLTYVVGFFLWVAVGWLLFVNGLADETLGILVFLISAALIGGACYLVSKSLVNRFSKGRMKPTCTTHDYAVRASPGKPNVRIWFSSDAYAHDFASLNNLKILMPAESA